MRDSFRVRVMAVSGRNGSVVAFMRRTAASVEATAVADGDLLARFAASRDEDAFALLVTRHGSMVLDVCRSILGNEADAEDAFQATFLVLARDAGRIRKSASLGAWLYGVALRTSRKARGRIATRRTKEAAVATKVPANPDDFAWRDVRRAVHEALALLSDRYRSPLVLCYLQGLSQDAAAVSLGLSKAAMKKRLERGREKLRCELIRRGLGPTALLAALAVPLVQVPHAMAAAAVDCAVLFSAGRAASIPVHILNLTEGGRSMFVAKLIPAVCLFPALVAGVLAGTSEESPGQPGVALPVVNAAEPAPGQKDKKTGSAADPDVEKIAGEWKIKRIETNGEGLLSEEQLKESSLTFKGQTAEVKGFDILGSGKFIFKLDSSKTPKEIDVKLSAGPQKGETFQGIYLVRKDEIRMCLRLEGTELGRPKGYVTTSGTTLYTFILERPGAKPGAKPAVPPIRPTPAPATPPGAGDNPPR